MPGEIKPGTGEPEPEKPAYIIEGARSAQAKCKSCRKKIDKGVLRLGVLIEGPFGLGHLWHHLTCAAKRRLEDVEEAYRIEAWQFAQDPPEEVPSIEELRKLHEEAEEKKEARKRIPYVEVDPSGRAKCKFCGEVMEKGSLRVVLGREIEFGSQYRTMPIHVHPRCVADELEKPDCGTEADGFARDLRANSEGLTEEQIDSVLSDVGELPEAGEEADEPPF